MGTVACAPEPEPSPWLLPVPPSVPTFIYADVAPEERARNTIQLSEDLIFRGDEPGHLLGRAPARLAPLPNNGVAVLDPANHRVLLFGEDGTPSGRFGRQGQGPGEFEQPAEIFLASGGDLRVWDVVGRQLSAWTTSGDFLATVTLPRWGAMMSPVGADDLVWRESRRTPTGIDTLFMRVNMLGELVESYAVLPWPERTIDPPPGEITSTESNAWWVGTVPPSFATDTLGNVYVSPFEEYQIFAYSPDGSMRWALQVAHTRPPIARVEIEFHMAVHARRFPQRTEGMIDWPERQFALADVRVDGHGHIYVFPFVPKGTPSDSPRPVDVYSSDGTRLFSGHITGRNFTTSSATYNGPMYEIAWQRAVGDFVYGVAENVAGDHEPVRFRLNEPF